jgi:hypothetical protein
MRVANNIGGCGCASVFGLLFFILGLGIALFVPEMMREEANRIEQMKPASAAAMANAGPGQEVLVEGRISERNPQVRGALVAYIHERLERDSDGDREWEVYSTEAPSLLIELPDGRIQVAQNYEVKHPSRSERQGDHRYRGFGYDDQVLVVGTAVRGFELPEIQAEFVSGGTQASYVEGQRTGAIIVLVISGVFAVVGLIVMATGVFSGLRSMF